MMRFDRRFLTVVGVSLAWALVVSVAFYRLAGGAGGHTRAAALKQVVIATKPLLAGSMVERDSVTLRGVPDNLLPPGAFSRLEEVLDRPVISDIQAEEAVVGSRIAAKGSGTGLGPLIPPGMRAVSVRVNDVVGVAGFVMPGMRVDVLVTGRPPSRGDTDMETQTVLQNITVLSAGQSIQNDGKSQPNVVPVVTLLVTPAGAEDLTLANAEGKIQLVLRNSTDRALVATGGRRLHELYGSAPAATAEVPLPRVEVARSARAGLPAAKRAAGPPVARPALTAAEPAPAPAAARGPDRMVVMSGGIRKVQIFSPEESK
jgi:pilus assembly protein CpaB